MRFGLTILPEHRWADAAPMWRAAEQLGFDHAWTYDQAGALVGVLSQKDFGDVDTSCLGLVALPVAERAGLIWVQLTPEPTVAIATNSEIVATSGKYFGLRRTGLVSATTFVAASVTGATTAVTIAPRLAPAAAPSRGGCAPAQRCSNNNDPCHS